MEFVSIDVKVSKDIEKYTLDNGDEIRRFRQDINNPLEKIKRYLPLLKKSLAEFKRKEDEYHKNNANYFADYESNKLLPHLTKDDLINLDAQTFIKIQKVNKIINEVNKYIPPRNGVRRDIITFLEDTSATLEEMRLSKRYLATSHKGSLLRKAKVLVENICAQTEELKLLTEELKLLRKKYQTIRDSIKKRNNAIDYKICDIEKGMMKHLQSLKEELTKNLKNIDNKQQEFLAILEKHTDGISEDEKNALREEHSEGMVAFITIMQDAIITNDIDDEQEVAQINSHSETAEEFVQRAIRTLEEEVPENFQENLVYKEALSLAKEAQKLINDIEQIKADYQSIYEHFSKKKRSNEKRY